MPHSFGYRAHTRDLFQKKFRKHGTLPTQTFLKVFRIGQIVDLAGDGAVHKGMPHKFYHGKTGIVWNVTPRAIGVVVNKRVNTRIVQKRLHVRIEHAKHSKCRQEFLDRVKRNEQIKKEVKAKKGPKVNTKRIVPDQPKAGRFVEGGKRVITLAPLAYVGLYQG